MARIYLDHSATTPLDPRVLDHMLPSFGASYGNSMAVHAYGQAAERAVEGARASIAHLLNVNPAEVVFTSGGTESDNLALRGPAQAARVQGRPFTLITGPVEHEAITATARQLRETLGASLRVVPVDRVGRVSPDDLRAALRALPDNGIAVVSLIHANNEVGTINPTADLAAVAHEHGAFYHTDAVQAPGQLMLDVDALGVDMLSMSSHKFYGPKGAGVLVLRRDVPFLSSSTGASHEDHRRAGTHNTPGIVGTAHALELARESLPEEAERLTALRDALIGGILEGVDAVQLTGDPVDRLPGHASFVFRGVDANLMLMLLDQEGIAASSGSACKTGNPQPSPLLEACGFGPDWTRGGLRLTLGRHTTPDEITQAITIVIDVVERARKAVSLNWT
ncbi:MAG TPA: cysteine desulfurase family protein [Aggregatilinea sp.]|uniref:cysteine desulfurase family protein n=1 Tax=Aggregatilinea sp. TaxID=2806333 RepID=UPI002B94B934|nr:cysteine desulfurase family protein [Aggregatilinea sp.]HML21653.1 cysteine desulfurase family protein [Aggregatilinea sp.]